MQALLLANHRSSGVGELFEVLEGMDDNPSLARRPEALPMCIPRVYARAGEYQLLLRVLLLARSRHVAEVKSSSVSEGAVLV